MSSFPFSFILILYVARDTRVKQVHVMFATCLRLSFQRTVLLDLLYTLVYLKLAHAVITVSLHREQFSYVKRTQFSMRVSETISILCRTNPWKHFFLKSPEFISLCMKYTLRPRNRMVFLSTSSFCKVPPSLPAHLRLKSLTLTRR